MSSAVRLPFGAGYYDLAPSKIICLGLNYRDHIRESVTVAAQGRSHDDPVEPVLFNKLPSSLAADGEAIVLPGILADYRFEDERTDYEGEIALVMGRGGSDIPQEIALEHVLGVTVANDISQRNIQKGDRSGWLRGKSFDSFCPVGPRLVAIGELDDPMDLGVETRLNGRIVQSGRSSQMIFSIPFMIHYISRNFRLESGDMILTGTPSGVGPLVHGDQVEVTVESVGTLSNPVIDRRRE